MASNQRDSRVKVLSTKVLTMMFMQRAEEAQVQRDFEEEEKRKQTEAQWEVDPAILKRKLAKSQRFESVESYIPFISLSSAVVGRQSFNGFNEALESGVAKKKKEQLDASATITDVEPVDIMGSNGSAKGKRKDRGDKRISGKLPRYMDPSMTQPNLTSSPISNGQPLPKRRKSDQTGRSPTQTQEAPGDRTSTRFKFLKPPE